MDVIICVNNGRWMYTIELSMSIVIGVVIVGPEAVANNESFEKPNVL